MDPDEDGKGGECLILTHNHMKCNLTIFGVSGLTRFIFEEKSSQPVASFLQPDCMEDSPFQRLHRFFSLCARKLLSPTRYMWNFGQDVSHMGPA